MRALLEGLVPGLPAAADAVDPRAGRAASRCTRSRLIRMLVGDGRARARRRRDLPRRRSRSTTIDIPASLRSLVAARLDALPAADRALLQDAAVLGQTFTVEALASLTGESAGTLEPRLRALIRPRPAGPRHRSPLAGTRPVRVRPVGHPRGRLRHARQARPAGPPPRRGPLLRGARRRGAGWRPRDALPGGVPGGRRRAGGRCARRPGADRAARRRGTSCIPGIADAGDRLLDVSARVARSGAGPSRAGPAGGGDRRGGGPSRAGRGPIRARDHGLAGARRPDAGGACGRCRRRRRPAARTRPSPGDPRSAPSSISVHPTRAIAGGSSCGRSRPGRCFARSSHGRPST